MAQVRFLAYAMLMGAAGAWDLDRFRARAPLHLHAPCTGLWQILVAAGLLLPSSTRVEGLRRALEATGAASLAYFGPIATAFAYWAAAETGRHFRASTFSVTLLATPSREILISSMTLGERVGTSLAVAVFLTGAGILLGIRASSRKPTVSSRRATGEACAHRVGQAS